jgi:glycosyltransferase involved in cell wall biosynthesis
VLPLGAVAAASRPRPPGARRRFGFVGTLAPHKGVHVLVEAFRGMESREASLDLYGSVTVQPAYVEELRRAAGGDARIRFRGSFREGEQARVLASVDALVVPSVWWENSPLVALEALAAGVPVIASAIGGLPEIVEHGRSGLLVPARDARALREALEDTAAGRRLGEELPALDIKTADEGARELAALYAALHSNGGP